MRGEGIEESGLKGRREYVRMYVRVEGRCGEVEWMGREV